MAKCAKAFGLLCLVLLILVFTLAAAQDPPISSAAGISSAEAGENAWVSKAPMQEARAQLGVATVNGKIYAIGGSTASGTNPGTVGRDYKANGWIVGTNEEYNPASDEWAVKTSMPTPRFDFAIAVYQNKIYCIGGISDYVVPNVNRTGVNEVYDPATDKWETRTPMPTARSGLQANVVNGKIYLIGSYPNYTLNEVYDPATDSWNTKASMPTAMNDYASAIVDNKIYFINSKLNQIYDAESDQWSYGAPPPSLANTVYSGSGTSALQKQSLSP